MQTLAIRRPNPLVTLTRLLPDIIGAGAALSISTQTQPSTAKQSPNSQNGGIERLSRESYLAQANPNCKQRQFNLNVEAITGYQEIRDLALSDLQQIPSRREADLRIIRDANAQGRSVKLVRDNSTLSTIEQVNRFYAALDQVTRQGIRRDEEKIAYYRDRIKGCPQYNGE